MVTMTFNGHNLFTEFGVLVNQRTTFLPPCGEQFEVDGRDGLVEFSNNVFDMRTLLVECFMYDPKRITQKQRQLAGLLSQRGRISFLMSLSFTISGASMAGLILLGLITRLAPLSLASNASHFSLGLLRALLVSGVRSLLMLERLVHLCALALRILAQRLLTESL